MKKFKRLIAVAVLVIFSGAFLTGCVLFARDVAHANSLTVASVGNSIRITRRQLNDAWGTWGFQFMQQGMTQRQAVEETLRLLIDREIMVYLSKQDRISVGDDGYAQFFGSHGFGILTDIDGNYTEALTLDELNLALHNVFNSMNNNIREISNQVRTESNLEQNVPAPDPDAPEHPVLAEHNPFIRTIGAGTQRRFELNLSRFETQSAHMPVLTRADFDGEQTVQEVIHAAIDAYLETAFEPRLHVQDEINVMRDTRNRIGRALRGNEQGLTFAYERDMNERERMDAAVRRELVRMLGEEERNQLVQRFRDMHAQGTMSAGAGYFELFANRHNERNLDGTSPMTVWRNRAIETSESYVNGLVARVRDQYIRETRDAVRRFERGAETAAEIGARVITEIENVRFVPQSIVNHYFTVSHVLLGFTEAQQEEIRQINADFARGAFSEAEHLRRTEIVRSQLTVTERVNGREVGEPLSANRALLEIERVVRASHNPQAAFQTQIYRFNSDPGMFNANFEYTMGIDVREIDRNGNPIGEDVNNRMVPEFAAESRRLFNFQGPFATGRPTTGEEITRSGHAIGTPGAMSGLVWTDFGAHIIMYTRPVSDFIFSNDESRLNQTYHNFLFATQTSYSNNGQTFFDSILENITRSDFSDAEAAVLGTFKSLSGNGVNINRRNFSNMW